MNIWAVFTESGEYESYSRDLAGVFATKELADAFAIVAHGEVEEWCVLDAAPIKVTQYHWREQVEPYGKLAPPRELRAQGTAHFGRSRYRALVWEHLAEHRSCTGPWNGDNKPSRSIVVSGTDLAVVKAEHKRLVAEARAWQADLKKSTA